MRQAAEARLAMSKTVDEGCNLSGTVYYRQAGAAYTPTTVEWKLRNASAGADVTGWTSATPGGSVAISVPSANLAIDDEGRDYELFELSVVANRGLSTQIPLIRQIRVRNAQSL